MSHYAESGLQEHSIGDIYPLSIVVKKTPGRADGVCELTNLVTGRVLKVCHFGHYLDPFVDFQEVHEYLESVAKQQVGDNRPYKSR